MVYILGTWHVWVVCLTKLKIKITKRWIIILLTPLIEVRGGSKLDRKITACYVTYLESSLHGPDLFNGLNWSLGGLSCCNKQICSCLSLSVCLLGITPWSLWRNDSILELVSNTVTADIEFESYNWLIISSFSLDGGPTSCKFWIPTICMSVVYEMCMQNM